MNKEAPKVGTKFRWVGGESKFYTQGNTYSVTTEVDASGLFSIDDNFGPHWWNTRLMEGKFVEVVGSPIRTSREIVPGVYGPIEVGGVNENGRIYLRVVGDAYKADDIRELIHIASQVLEVLEENAG